MSRTQTSARWFPLFAIALALASWFVWRVSMPGEPPPAQRDTEPAQVNAAALSREVTRATTSGGRAAVVTGPTIPTPIADFDRWIGRLVSIGIELVEVVERREVERARTIDGEARDLLVQIANAFSDVGDKCLTRIAALPEIDGSVEQGVRRQVLQRVLGDDLERRFTAFEKGAPRGGLDSLVTSMLELVPKDRATANSLGDGVLVDRPYLAPAHEEAVLHMLDLSRVEPWLGDVAARLLHTLWTNLEKTGARSRSDIASLALLFFDDANPAHRAAALRELLRDPRLRRLVIDRARRGGDPAFAAQVGAAAAQDLDPTTALEVVRELHPAGGTRMLSASVSLGARSPAAVRRAYEEALGDGRDPAFRADLLIAATLGNDPGGCELAEIAFREDPDLAVRNRALMALTACPDATVGERSLSTLLDDPVLGKDPAAVQWCVAGLENLAQVGDANAVQRIGSRLLIHPLIGESDRAQVRAILTRAGVPTGQGG